MSKAIKCGWCGENERVTFLLCAECGEVGGERTLCEQEEQDMEDEQEEARKADEKAEEDRLFLHTHIADFDEGFFV